VQELEVRLAKELQEEAKEQDERNRLSTSVAEFFKELQGRLDIEGVPSEIKNTITLQIDFAGGEYAILRVEPCSSRVSWRSQAVNHKVVVSWSYKIARNEKDRRYNFVPEDVSKTNYTKIVAKIKRVANHQKALVENHTRSINAHMTALQRVSAALPEGLTATATELYHSPSRHQRGGEGWKEKVITITRTRDAVDLAHVRVDDKGEWSLSLNGVLNKDNGLALLNMLK
jgi:hypothetical protein